RAGAGPPPANRGNVAGDADAHRMVRSDEPWTAKAIASPAGQPNPGPAMLGSRTPTYTSALIVVLALVTVTDSAEVWPTWSPFESTARLTDTRLPICTGSVSLAVWPFIVTLAVSVWVPSVTPVV